jgi:hypothetical protein
LLLVSQNVLTFGNHRPLFERLVPVLAAMLDTLHVVDEDDEREQNHHLQDKVANIILD